MYLKLLQETKEDIVTNYNKPYYVYLSLTNICNANCKFCDVKSNELKKCSIDVYSLIDELCELGTKYIHFTGGGEPFINDEIFKYIKYASNKRININVITNGLNLNEEKIKKLSQYNINSIFFSIDSHLSEIHDDLRRVNGLWRIVTNNINLIKKYMPNVKIVINHVLNKENISDFDKFIQLKKNYNFDYINPLIIKDCDELFFSEQQIEVYNEKLQFYIELAKSLNIEFLCDNIDFFKKNVSCNGDRMINLDLKCIYPSYCVFVDAPSGFVYPCDCSIHRDRKLYKIGDLHKESFKEIWNGEKRKLLQEKLLNSELDCKTKCDEANCQFNKKYFKMRNLKK